ncbi:hypothetical protein HMPREF0501_00929 [Limosilactobacillus coleohominis 101-4-CHN]|uniref:O-antigen polymerase n=1 Tax=Limosilactobacillus coleohominis 101-4-CHN TaxID=575594 RepID=C7XW35_9LACO|nr:hypothetical protein [Limosilactobacillus coleohominis]EEU30551.1 hypothetical protein HMPREF0501_00929 [Limosilactobacillus coleohominis 101-4-CHN]
MKKVLINLYNFEFDGQFIYEIAFVYNTFLTFLSGTTATEYLSGQIIHLLSYLGIALVLYKIFFLDKINLKWLLLGVVILSLLVLTWRTSKDFSLFTMGIFILGGRDVNFTRVVHLFFYVTVILLIGIMLMSGIGIIRNLVYHRSGVIRQSLGITYPTDLAAHILYAVLAYTYLRFAKINWKDYSLLILIAILVYWITQARLNTICILSIIPTVYIGKMARKGNSICKFISSFYWTIPVTSAYLIFMLSYFYISSNKIFEKVNNLLSNRLYLGHKALRLYSVSIFGTHMRESGWGGIEGLKMMEHNTGRYFFVDSSFIRMFILYGLIMGIIILIIMTIISWLSIQRGSYNLASIIVILSMSAVIEQHLLEIAFNPFFISLIPILSSISLKGSNNFGKIYSKSHK